MLKKIDESPTISDTIEFDILCHDADGCFSADPYKVDKVVIYSVQRDFASGNPAEYEAVHMDNDFQEQLLAAEKKACQFPTEENIEEVRKMEMQATSYSKIFNVYYNEAVPVAVFGSDRKSVV